MEFTRLKAKKLFRSLVHRCSTVCGWDLTPHSGYRATFPQQMPFLLHPFRHWLSLLGYPLPSLIPYTTPHQHMDAPTLLQLLLCTEHQSNSWASCHTVGHHSWIPPPWKSPLLSFASGLGLNCWGRGGVDIWVKVESKVCRKSVKTDLLWAWLSWIVVSN